MRRTTVRRIVITGLFAVAAFAGRSALAAEKAPNDRILPPQTYFFLTVPNSKEIKSSFNKSTFGRLMKEPKMADFLASLQKKIAQLSEMFEKQTELKLDDLANIPDGELSIAVMQPSTGTKIAVVGLLDFGKSGSAVGKLLEKASGAMEKNGFKKSTRDCEGSQATIFTREKEKEKGDDKKDAGSGDKAEEPDLGSQIAYVLKNDSLIITSSVNAMKDVLRRWDGKNAEGLAEVAAYKAITDSAKKATAAPTALWYLNPLALVQAILKSSDSVDPNIGMALTVASSLGIDNLKAIGGSMHGPGEKYEAESQIQVYLDKPATGVLSVLQFPPISQSPPKWVADDSLLYVGLNWDLQTAYSAVETMVDQFLGPGKTAEKLDEFANQENGPKIHPKKDVLDNLDGMIHVVNDLADPGKPESARFLVAIGLKDAKKMKGVLGKLSKMPQLSHTREYRGETIYDIEGIPGFGDANHKAGLAVANDCLMFSTDVRRIEQALIGDKDRKSLADSDKYQKLAKNFPPKTSMICYQEQDTQVKTFWDMARSGQVTEKAANTPFAPLVEGLDFTKLPDFDVVRKYFPPSGMYAVPHGNGALIIAFSVKQPEN
jgi:hypothetical protein